MAHVDAARTVIPAVFLDSPQYEDELLNAALGTRVTVKVETANPLLSFKGRAVSYALRKVTAGERVVCASSGNFGQAVAFVGRARGARVRVYAPTPLNPVKRERILAFGAHVVEVTGGGEQARHAAAAAEDALLLVDGVDTALAEGAATIAQELTAAASFDTIVAPVGDGSLISGLACGPAPMHLQHASSGSFRLGAGHAPLPRSSPAQTPTPPHSPPSLQRRPEGRTNPLAVQSARR